MAQQVNINYDPTAVGVRPAMLVRDAAASFAANLTADPNAPSVIQVALVTDPLASNLLYLNISNTLEFTRGWSPLVTPVVSGGAFGSGFYNMMGSNSGSGGMVLAAAATVSSISVYCRVAGGNILLGLYDGTGGGGLAGNLIASTTSTPLSVGWNRIGVTTPAVVPAGSYWIIMACDSGTPLPGVVASSTSHYFLGGQSYTMPAIAPGGWTGPDGSSLASYATFNPV